MDATKGPLANYSFAFHLKLMRDDTFRRQLQLQDLYASLPLLIGAFFWKTSITPIFIVLRQSFWPTLGAWREEKETLRSTLKVTSIQSESFPTTIASGNFKLPSLHRLRFSELCLPSKRKRKDVAIHTKYTFGKVIVMVLIISFCWI